MKFLAIRWPRPMHIFGATENETWTERICFVHAVMRIVGLGPKKAQQSRQFNPVHVVSDASVLIGYCLSSFTLPPV